MKFHPSTRSRSQSNSFLMTSPFSCRRFSLALLGLICIAGVARATDKQEPPLRVLGVRAQDSQSNGILYSREELAAMAKARDAAKHITPDVMPREFVPSGGTSPPFWRYANFGYRIGASNIIISPTSTGGGAREIIIGGSSLGGSWPNEFWQVIRHNPESGTYDQLFVSPMYTAGIVRILLGNLVGDSARDRGDAGGRPRLCL
jgi:hypothetical protein